MPKSLFKVYATNRLVGGINTTSSPDNLVVFPEDARRNGVEYKGTQFIDMENFYPLDRGGIKKVQGFSPFISTGTSSPITGITRFQKTDGTNQFIYSQGSSVYRQGSGTPIATVASGANVNFCVGNNLLVICDGSSQTQWWDGTSIHQNANTSLPTATTVPAFYQNRFWFLTNTSPNQNNAYFSAPNDITTGYGDSTLSGGFVQCDYNDGDVCVGMVSTFLTNSLNPVLIVGKNRKLGIIQNVTTSATSGLGIVYGFSAIDNVIGIASQRSLCRVSEDVFYFNRLGLTAGRTQVNYNQLYAEYLSVNVSNQFNGGNISTLSNAIVFYDYMNYRVCVAVNETGFSYPNVLWCYDVRLDCWYKERWGGTNNITAAFIDTDGTFYHGDSNGNIYKHASSYTSFNNGKINAYAQLPYMSFGDPGSYKEINMMTADISGGSKTNVQVSYRQDYGSSSCPDDQIPPATTGYIWGGGVWTSNPSTYQWGNAAIANERWWPQSYFRNISTRFTHNDASNNLEIFGISWEVMTTPYR